MPPSIDDLLTPLSEDDVLGSMLDILESLGVPAKSWRTGGSLRTILRVVARTYANFTTIIAQAIAGAFLEKSAGAWLTLLAYFVYNVTRPAATFATGEATLENTGGGVFDFAIGELTILNGTTKKAYTNAEAIHLPPATAITFDVVAKEVGTASNAAAGQIDTLETTLLGVTVTNAEAVVGQDEMNDADLRQLCKDKLGTLSNGGPRGAYRFAVREATRPDGTLVNINRVSVSPWSSTGTVNIYVAAPSGAPDPLDVTYVIESIAELAVPDAVTVNVYAATEVPVTRTLTLWCTRVEGLDVAAKKAAAEAKLIAAIAVYAIAGYAVPPSSQGYLFSDYIRAIAKSAAASCFHVDDGGAADVALDAGEVATLGSTIVVRIVEGS